MAIPGHTFQGIETYSTGGGYTEADQLSFSPIAVASAGHGAWKMTTARTFDLTYLNLTFDSFSSGNPRVRQTTTITKNGESYTGSEVEAIRALDESWVAAGQSKSVDTWVAFYADDAAVLPPNEPIATSRGAIRKSVSELLTLPGLSIDWKPTQIEVARSGELAYLCGAYRPERDDSGKRAKDSGKNVEIWKKQLDGRWKCIVDTWNSDLPTNLAPIK